MNLVVCFKETPVEPRLIAPIAAAWPEMTILNVGQTDLPAALLEADYFCGHAKIPVDWPAIVSKRRLQWIQSSAAGMDWCLVPEVITADHLTLTTASGVLADQVAEHTLALLLAFTRNLRVFMADQFGAEIPDRIGAENWRTFIRRPTTDLTGATVGIVGFGGVGRRLADVLVPWKTTIVATDLFPTNKPASISELWPADRLDDLLAICDIVVLCLPLNSETRGLFDKQRLETMKKGAILANMARGPLVKTDDLVALLQKGHLSGAVMDVTSPEPLPPNHPLWDLPNVLITPHVGGQNKRRFDEVVRISVQNIHRYQAGQPLINYLTPEGKKLGFPLRCAEYPLWIDVRDK